MRPGRPAAAPPLVLAAALSAAAAAPAAGQEAGRGRACTLVLEPATDSTRSVRVEVAENTYVTHLTGGLRWTCGDARMVADSAVRRDAEGELEMIGSVDYRDSTRTLVADTVTYLEADDRIVAEGSVLLTRLRSGSTLEGPRVEFDRAPTGEVRRTEATGRPTMTLRREGAADTTPPVEVDADRIVMLGEEEARSWGDVRIRRPGIRARSDSAVFRMEDEVGELYGSPEVRGETWRLVGRTIRTRFEEGDLREVTAVEEGHAIGEEFELFAERIHARTAGREIERLWAHGEGRSVAYSPPYRLSADSLAFRFAGGDIDEMDAVREAEAVQVGEEIPEEPTDPVPLDLGDRSWMNADTLKLAFGPPGPARRGDGRSAGTVDSLRAGDASSPGEQRTPDGPGERLDAGGAAPRLPAAAADSVVGVYPSHPLGPGGDGGGGPAAADEDGREIEIMRALGNARAYHLLEPERQGERPPRHYQRGREIVMHFEGGEATRIEGVDAIGLHLDPSDEAAAGDTTAPVPPAGSDTAGPPPGDDADPGGAAPDTAPADAVQPDTVPADTTRADTLRREPVPTDTVPPHTVAADDGVRRGAAGGGA